MKTTIKKTTIKLSAAIAVLLLSRSPALLAQTNSASAPAGVLAAVIDLNKVFESHTAFQQRIKQIETDVQAFDTHVNGEREKLKQQGERLQILSPGSADYRQLEENLARQLSELQVEAQLKKKDVVEREAKAYFDAYNQVQAAVAAVAQQHGITLVLRYDSSDIDPNDRASVLRGVNRAVVYQKNLDITALVLDRLNPQAARQGGVAPGVRRQ